MLKLPLSTFVKEGQLFSFPSTGLSNLVQHRHHFITQRTQAFCKSESHFSMEWTCFSRFNLFVTTMKRIVNKNLAGGQDRF